VHFSGPHPPRHKINCHFTLAQAHPAVDPIPALIVQLRGSDSQATVASNEFTRLAWQWLGFAIYFFCRLRCILLLLGRGNGDIPTRYRIQQVIVKPYVVSKERLRTSPIEETLVRCFQYLRHPSLPPQLLIPVATKKSVSNSSGVTMLLPLLAVLHQTH
jgi:hypothetical protein